MTPARKRPSPQERSIRWLLLLTLLHTVPVLWLTPVVAGSAPTAALLAFGFANLLTLQREGAALGLMLLAPALLYLALAWLLARLLARIVMRGATALRAALVALLTLVPLAATHWPIYIAGGHTSTRHSDLMSLVDGALPHATFLTYWIALHAVLVALFAASLLHDDHPVFRAAARWRRPVLAGVASIALVALLFARHDVLVCRPLAELGIGRAQLCLARADRSDSADWYARAAENGVTDAIAWMSERAPDRAARLDWLHRGARAGDAAIAFALHEALLREGDPGGDGREWLQRAAAGGHAPAQLALADALTAEALASPSDAILVERNDLLERAAAQGHREALARRAQESIDGSLGRPIDHAQARDDYGVLAAGAPTAHERVLGIDAAYYRARVAEIDTWEAGLAGNDPHTMKVLAERYLGSPLPGQGVRARGRELLEHLATTGDAAARDRLIADLRTGADGFETNVDAARAWLIRAADSGDSDAMQRVAYNYLHGREGFALDYGEARRRFDALLAHHAVREPHGDDVRRFEREIAHVERLVAQAGGPLLDEATLAELARRSDPESSYRYAMQRLVQGQHQEAKARLEGAAQQGHAAAAWRLVEIYERGFAEERDPAKALANLRIAADNHHFDATRELAASYEQGKRGLAVDLPHAVELYEAALAAGRDNRYGWNLDPENFDHFRWLESRLRQARLKLAAKTAAR